MRQGDRRWGDAADAPDALGRRASGHIGGSFVMNCDHMVP
jgi:hypothetical protein